VAAAPDQQALVGVEPAQEPGARERIELVDEGPGPGPGPVGVVDRSPRGHAIHRARARAATARSTWWTEGMTDPREPEDPLGLLGVTPGHPEHPVIDLEPITEELRAIAKPPIHAQEIDDPFVLGPQQD